MGLVKTARDAFDFIFTLQFWRMAFLWTLSLIFSYLKLFTQSLLSPSSEIYKRCSLNDHVCTTPTLSKPLCIVTGATSGLGAEVAFSLSKEGFYVVLAGRSPELLSRAIHDIKSQNNDACLKAFQVDLSSFNSIMKFKSSLQQWLSDSNMHPSVQLLVNNAGILSTSYRHTYEGYDQMIATNYIGAFHLTKALHPLLENSAVPSRVVNVTSFTHRNAWCRQVDKDAISGRCFVRSGSYPYAYLYEYSKLCILLFSYELHQQLCAMQKSHQISVVAADPGVVRTNIMREIPSCVSGMAFMVLNFLGLLQSSEIGAQSILDAALCPPEVSGVYFFGGNGRTLKSSTLSYDPKLAKDLWTTSCDLFQELLIASGKDELS